MTATVAIVDPGARVPELDCYNRIAARSALPTSYHLPAMFGLASLRRNEADLAGVVVLGSGASVHDPLPWQDGLRGWLAGVVDAGVPVLGLCYGHQLLAQIFGGEIGFLFDDRHKRKGLREISLRATPLWGAARDVRLLVTHREVVLGVPPGCVAAGSSAEVEVEAFRHATLEVYGVQAHPEATPAFATNNDVPFDGVEADLTDGHALVDAFVDRCAARVGA